MAIFWVENGNLKAKDLIPGSVEDSLAKWEYLFNLCVAGELVHGGGSYTCSLCFKYIRESRRACVGCPIYEHTGKLGCYDTPYENYRAAFFCGDLPAATSAAEDMMLFLEKLLFGSL